MITIAPSTEISQNKSNFWARVREARWLWMPAFSFILTRLGIFLAIYVGAILIADNPVDPPYHLRHPTNLIVDALGSRWDTGFYVSIVEEGYILRDVPLPNAAFFPLLPLLMKAVLPLAGDELIAGILVSNLALLFAAILFYRLVQMEWGDKVADRAVWYLLIFPTAIFGSAIYSESLFLLTTIGAYYFAKRGKWDIAMLFAIFATLTRFVGLIVVPLLALEWWRQWRENGENPPSIWALRAPALAPLGTAGFMLYLWQKFGNPLAFMEASSAWGRTPQSPLDTIGNLLVVPDGGWMPAILAGHIHINDFMDLGFILAFILFGLILIGQRRWAEAAFVLLGVAIPFSSGLLMSQRRYMWVLFPVFILLARWGRNSWVDRLITTLFLVGLALFSALFANGYWVA